MVTTLVFLALLILMIPSADAFGAESKPEISQDEREAIKAQFKDPTTVEKVVSYLSTSRRLKFRLEHEPGSAPAVMAEIVSALVNASKEGGGFAEHRSRFADAMRILEQTNASIPPDAATPISNALLDMYARDIKRFPDRGPLVIDFVARYGGGPRAQTFVLEALKGKSAVTSALRGHALNALCWTQAYRTDTAVFDAAKSIYEADRKNYDALAAVSRLDPERAHPFLRQLVGAAKDAYTLNKVGGIISQMHRPDLVDAVLLRAESIRKVSDTFEGDPTFGVYDSAQVEHLLWAEGESLRRGLRLLGRLRVGRIRTALRQKLEKAAPADRLAMLGAVKELNDQGRLLDGETSQILDEHGRRDLDAGERSLLDSINSNLQERLKKAKP